MSVFTGVYQNDVQIARKLGLFSGINPKKEALQSLIADYLSTTNTANDTSESQKISESDRSSLLPKPILKADRKPLPMPVKKNNQFRVKPEAPKLKTKLPVNIDTVLRRKPAPPRLKGSGDIMLPKLGNRFNRSLFQ